MSDIFSAPISTLKYERKSEKQHQWTQYLVMNSIYLVIFSVIHTATVKQRCSVDATKYYFTNRVANNWNSLPCHIVNSLTLSTFKSRLQNHDISP